MAVNRLVTETLAGRVRTHGGGAFLTHYRRDRGERTELSAISFGNWVDKTGNLLDELDVDADAEVALPVLVEAPGHWMGLVWPFALWQRGLPARAVPRAEATAADLAVIGPDDLAPVGATTIACSLDPWGRALPSLPAGVLDYATEALAQPDAGHALPLDADDLAWSDARRSASFGDLAALAPVTGRVIARVEDSFAATALLVRALAGGGSVVLVGDDGDLAGLAEQERATVVAGRVE